MGWVEIKKNCYKINITYKYVLFNPSGGVYPLYLPVDPRMFTVITKRVYPVSFDS